jgi:rhodanese family protein|nr:rhodanese-like domain-containing protein [Neisseria sicca]
MSKEGQLPRITPAEAAAKICEGALAVDIRSQAEYRGGHIGCALSLPPERHRDKLSKMLPPV